MNGRLYRSLQEKADELQRLTEYNENILESMDSGILVLDLDGRSRALEPGDGNALPANAARRSSGRPLDEIFPESFLEIASRQPGAGRTRGDRPHLQAPPPHARRPQPDGERLGRAVPDGLRRAPRNGADPRGRDRAHAPRGAAPALGEDGLHRHPRGGRRPRGQHAPDGHLVLHPDAPGADRARGPALPPPREDREADLPRRQDHQQPPELLPIGERRARDARRQQGASRRALARRAPAREEPGQGRAGSSPRTCPPCAATRTASSRSSST